MINSVISFCRTAKPTLFRFWIRRNRYQLLRHKITPFLTVFQTFDNLYLKDTGTCSMQSASICFIVWFFYHLPDVTSCHWILLMGTRNCRVPLKTISECKSIEWSYEATFKMCHYWSYWGLDLERNLKEHLWFWAALRGNISRKTHCVLASCDTTGLECRLIQKTGAGVKKNRLRFDAPRSPIPWWCQRPLRLELAPIQRLSVLLQTVLHKEPKKIDRTGPTVSVHVEGVVYWLSTPGKGKLSEKTGSIAMHKRSAQSTVVP